MTTVLVLGAGASVEFGLPVGSALCDQISKKLRFRFQDFRQIGGDEAIYRELQRARSDDLRAYSLAGNEISSGIGYSKSVDDYLYKRGDNKHIVELGKVAVATSILEAENKSSIFKLLDPASPGTATDNSERALQSLGNTWIHSWFKSMQSSVRLSEIEHIFDDFAVINFNYDRCFETYLYFALQVAYPIDRARAERLMKTLRIVHPYGQVGLLPWDNRPGMQVGFGHTPKHLDLFKLASEIRTFTEERDRPEIDGQIAELIESADRVIFLGFGFHKQNMEMLRCTAKRNLLEVWSTAFETSAADRETFEQFVEWSLFEGTASNRLKIEPLDCRTMIRDYGLQFTTRL